MVTPLSYLLAGVVLVLLPVGAGLALARIRAGSTQAGADVDAGRERSLELRIFELEQKVELLPKTWEKFRDGTIQAEQRARHHLRKAQRLAEASLADDDDGDGVPESDGSGSPVQGVLPLRAALGSGPQSVDSENELIRLAARVKGLVP